jgi:CubicO group peptidase (beta-lactamase class C family)
VDHPVRMQQRFERRNIGEPGIFSECVLVVGPALAAWRDGRQAAPSNIAKYYLGLPIEHPPGTQFRYGQANYYFAAYIIEALSGIPFNAYVKREIFGPVGMSDTFYIPDRTRTVYAPGGDLHFTSHGSIAANDHGNDEGGTPQQFARVLDLKRIPVTIPARVVADIAPPLVVPTAGDPNWDEAREGWTNPFPEGGLFSTATDLLKFLTFLRNGRTGPNGQTVTLTPDSLRLITSEIDPVSGRTYAFATNHLKPGSVIHNGLWGTYIQRDSTRCISFTVLLQAITEPPHGEVPFRPTDHGSHGALLDLRSAIIRALSAIDSTCPV